MPDEEMDGPEKLFHKKGPQISEIKKATNDSSTGFEEEEKSFFKEES